MSRAILHIDMDAFFASVEQRDEPTYRGKPLIVGGRPDSRGVVAACSYEARVFGVHSAMACARAEKLCPDAIFVKPRFEVYREVSVAIQGIFRRYTHQIEPLSLDEAYLDLSDSVDDLQQAVALAEQIRAEIAAELQLTASAGVSYNKFLAKLGSDMNKPNGLTLITEAAASDIIAGLPVRKFHGIGPATEQRMADLGIVFGSDLRECSEAFLSDHFGKAGRYYYSIARGLDERPVRSQRQRKSVGKETTFDTDVLDKRRLWQAVGALTHTVFERMPDSVLTAHTLTLKVRYSDFSSVTRSYSQAQGYPDADSVLQVLPQLLRKTEAGRVPVRLVGVALSGFEWSDGGAHQPIQRQLDFG